MYSFELDFVYKLQSKEISSGTKVSASDSTVFDDVLWSCRKTNVGLFERVAQRVVSFGTKLWSRFVGRRFRAAQNDRLGVQNKNVSCDVVPRRNIPRVVSNMLALWRQRLTRVSMATLAIGLGSACGAENESDKIQDELRAELNKKTTDESARKQRFAPELDLVAGFKPDPIVHQGALTPSRDATELAESCSGWIGDIPDLVLNAKTAFTSVHFRVVSDVDVNIVLIHEDGHVSCNKKTGKDIQLQSPLSSGRHKVWISAPKGTKAKFRLELSELPSDMK